MKHPFCFSCKKSTSKKLSLMKNRRTQIIKPGGLDVETNRDRDRERP